MYLIMNSIIRRDLLFFVANLVLGTIIFPLSPVWSDQKSLTGRGLATISTPKGATIFAEIADTPSKRVHGLMFRTTMAPDRGMLFAFPEVGDWTFWMKNTKMSLDILWMDASGEVVHIEPNVPICTRTDEGCPRYHSLKKSLYVLELKAGMAERFGIERGSQLSIAFPQHKH